MNKSSNRRFRNLARGYRDLVAQGHIEQFDRAWDQRMRAWLYEIERRARLQIQPDEAGLIARGEAKQRMARGADTRIFEVLDAANRLLKACGDAVEQLVGKETRATLSSECTRAVACIYDKRLYQPVKKQMYTRIWQL